MSKNAVAASAENDGRKMSDVQIAAAEWSILTVFILRQCIITHNFLLSAALLVRMQAIGGRKGFSHLCVCQRGKNGKHRGK
ncbi:hypothetical protein [Pantoea eucrina]|uniref:hypothetical protein n=1 Tax=Pantoea eucrina TaxID=472693 RepID=UPI001428CEC5|nr:hypothetical protein [Pantoea eucrina]